MVQLDLKMITAMLTRLLDPTSWLINQEKIQTDNPRVRSV